MVNPSITYVSITCNRGTFLQKNITDQFLSRHFDLDGIDFDIVIVDDGSSDGTLEKIRSICNGEVGIPLTFIEVKRRQGPYYYSDSTLINTGVLKSRGEFIYIASSDCYLCNKDAFQRLSKLADNSYMSPHLFRFDQNNSDLYKFCVKNWHNPEECLKFFNKQRPPWGAAYYDRIFGTGLVGTRKKTFCDTRGIPEIRGHGYAGGTDASMYKSLKDGGINIDRDASDVFVVHFPVPYAIKLSSSNPPYMDEHYTTIDGITVVKDEFLEIHYLTL